jgi:hypothetical protein
VKINKCHGGLFEIFFENSIDAFEDLFLLFFFCVVEKLPGE